MLHMVTVGSNASLDHDDEDHNDGNEGSVLMAKGVTMVTLCLVSMCMGIVPMQIAKCFKMVSGNQVINPRRVIGYRRAGVC